MIDDAVIRQAQTATSLASLLAGHPLRRQGMELVGACPRCGGKDRFQVNMRKRLWLCRGCGTGGDAIALVRHLEGLDFQEAVERLTGPSSPGTTMVHKPQDHRSPPPAAAATPSEKALDVWNEARDPGGTLVETYLRRRGVALPPAAGDVIRYHPDCRFGLQRVRAMVALVRGIQTDQPQAIHRTALDAAGNKLRIDGRDRMALGPVSGGAVKLTDSADVSTCLGVGEGIETTLSMQKVPEFGASPVWSLLSAGGIEAFPVLAGIEVLWIAEDRDPAGERAAAACGQRWTAAGQEVFYIRADREGQDLNDELLRSA